MPGKRISSLAATLLVLGVIAGWMWGRGGDDRGRCLQSSQGLWDVCRTEEQVYFDVPRGLIGKDLVVVKTRFEGGNSYAHGPVSNLLARWVLKGDVLVLQAQQPARRWADANGTLLDDRQDPLPWEDVAHLPVMSGRYFGKIGVDATRLFTTAVETWFPGGVASDLVEAQLETVRSFPKNVVVRTVAAAQPVGAAGKVTLTDWNFVLLPDRPMQSRLWDGRSPQKWVGFYNWRNQPAPGQPEVMLRWRLEKKHPDQAVSEPVEPIVVYIDPATPAKWRPYMRRAIEAWNVAFEAAGFRNAVVAREVDPDDDGWSKDDVRHTVLEWYRDDVLAEEDSDVRSRFYASVYADRIVFDPRTGELLQGSIGSRNRYPDSDHPYLSWMAKYFVRVAGLDPRADRFPVGDELRGEMIQEIATHEVGHLLGLVDGSFGKGVYTVAQVRDPQWVSRNGYTPSVMNYTRMNYVVQPEDGMPAELLQQIVGPADRFWIQMAYQVFPEAKNAWDELPHIEKFMALLDSHPEYRFNRSFGHEGPDSIMEVVETDDPVEASRLGLLNLRRSIAGFEAAASLGGIGRANVSLIETQALMFWRDLMGHVIAQVGGYTQYRRAGHEPHGVATPVPASAQRDAMEFIAREAFTPPLFLRDRQLTRLLPLEPAQPASDLTIISSLQRHVLSQLMKPQRIYRLAEAEVGLGFAVAEGERYTLTEFLSDVRKGIWSELRDGKISIDPFRQSLQEEHLRMLGETLSLKNPDPWTAMMRIPTESMPKLPIESFVRNAVKADVRELASALREAASRATDPVTSVHLARMRGMVEAM